MENNYNPPEFKKNGFNCPFCGAYAHQNWIPRVYKPVKIGVLAGGKTTNIPYIFTSTCERCGKNALWVEETLIYPDKSGIPNPNPDLPDDIKNDYLEAASIVNKSPRASAALLRLAVQKLCKELGESGNNINNDIANLVKKGLPVEIQQALDALRVIGNESVHPGQIDLNGKDEHVAKPMFNLINIIAERMITHPKKINEIYGSLPQDKLDAITIRDKK